MSELAGLLDEYRADLASFVRRHAGWLLRYEGADDLLQGAQLRALQQRDAFEFRGREPFLKWLYTVARTHLADRNAYWSALKRRPSRLVRLTSGDPGADSRAAAEPASTRTGPATFAARREQLALAVRVLGALLPRDAQLVRWAADDLPLDEQAARLGLSYDALKRARARALSRFRDAYDLATGL